MKSDFITFFPGKGIYYLPSGQEIVSVYKTEEARSIFSALSHFSIHNSFPTELSLELRNKTLQLKDFYEQKEIAIGPSSEHATEILPRLSFADIQYAGTRNSSGAKELDWTKIELQLKDRGYILKKRSYLEDAFNEVCPVFYLEHPEKGVVSEGKGLTEEQAKKSALAEGVERIIAKHPSTSAQKDIFMDTYNNMYDEKSWNLGNITGPRDVFTKEILTEWIPAKNISRNEDCYLPAEISYFEYVPETTQTRLFSLHHTMGLASGSSLEDAALSGIFEVLERDAYWITMRCRINCPDIALSEIKNLDSKILRIIELLREKGFELSLKDMSLDWGIPIAHAVLIDKEGRIPAFSHGTGASFNWSTAVARAVCEVLQMYAGLDAVTNENFGWEEVVSIAGVLGKPELAWSDPLYGTQIEHLTQRSPKSWSPKTSINSVEELLSYLQKKGHEVIVADLKSEMDIQVVRVVITNTTQPDTRLEKISKRLHEWKTREGLSKGFYSDPILT